MADDLTGHDDLGEEKTEKSRKKEKHMKDKEHRKKDKSQNSSKRKNEEGDDDDSNRKLKKNDSHSDSDDKGNKNGSDNESSKKKKKQKRRKSDSDEEEKKRVEKKKEVEEEDNDEDEESDSEDESAYATMDELTEALRRQFFGLLTPIEEDEMEIPDSSICLCRKMGQKQTDYLSKLMPDWDKQVSSQKRKASPLVLIVCASGIRCANLKRELASFLKGAKVAKLFSKHMKVAIKVDDQEKYLKSHVVNIGVGTPHRLKTLMELEALSLSDLTHIIVDWNFRDQKKRRLTDTSEGRCELNNLLRWQIIPHLRKKKHVKIGLM